jgi:hypothetical protein
MASLKVPKIATASKRVPKEKSAVVEELKVEA